MTNPAVFQDALIPGEDDPSFRCRDPDNLLIGKRFIVKAVKADQPQLPDQLSQVNIQHEPGIA
jgi:hypothetical protein